MSKHYVVTHSPEEAALPGPLRTFKAKLHATWTDDTGLPCELKGTIRFHARNRQSAEWGFSSAAMACTGLCQEDNLVFNIVGDIEEVADE